MLSVAEGVTTGCIERGFTGRSNSIAKAHTCLACLMAVDSASGTVASALLEASKSHKKPKVPPECLKALTKAYASLGAAALPNKQVLGALQPLLELKNKDARAAAADLALEVAAWLTRAPVDTALSGLKEVAKKELEGRLASVTTETAGNRRVPTRGTRNTRAAAEKAAAAKAASSGADGGNSCADGGAEADEEAAAAALAEALAQAAPAVNLMDLVDEVDLPQALNKTDFHTLVSGASKWSDKKAALDLLDAAIGPTPKLKAGALGLGELMRLVGSLLAHSHQHVSLGAVKAIARVAQGLQTQFAEACHGPELFVALTDRLKDKKLCPAVGDCLDALVHCGALPLERLGGEKNGDYDLAALVDPKKQAVPHARVAALHWFTRLVSRSTTAEADQGSSDNGHNNTNLSSALKLQLLAFGCAALEAQEPKGREAGEALVLACCGATCPYDAASKEHKAIAKHLNALTGVHKAKVAERAWSILKGESEAPSTTSSMASGSAATSGTTAPSKASSVVDEAPKNSKAGKGGTDYSKKASGGAAATAEASGEATAADKALENVASVTLNADDAVAALGSALFTGDEAQEQWTRTVLPNLSSSKWQDKVAGCAEVATRCGKGDCAARVGLGSEAVSVAAELMTKNWQDANAVVIKAALDMASACAAACAANELDVGGGVHGNTTGATPSFHRGAACALAAAAVHKLGDRKVASSAAALLTALAAAAGPGLVCGKVVTAANVLKAPPAVAAALEWCGNCCADFGAAQLPLKSLCGWVGPLAGHKDPKLRASALQVLAACYKGAGPRAKTLTLQACAKLPPAALRAVEDALDQAGYDPATACGLLNGGGNASAAGQSADSDGGGAAAAEVGAASSGTHGHAAGAAKDVAALLKVDDVVTALNNVGDKDAWKQRKAALDEVLSAVTARSGVVPLQDTRAFVELLRGVKGRVGDTQVNLKPLALQCLASLVRSQDPSTGAAARALKLCAADILAGAHDTRKPARDKVFECLAACITLPSGAIGEKPEALPGAMDALFPFVFAALHKAGPGRAELLAFFASHAEALSGPKACDASQLLPPLLACLADKAKDSRAAAEQCLCTFASAGLVTKSALDRAVQDLSPTVKRTLQSAVDRAHEAMAAFKAASAASAEVAAPPAVSATDSTEVAAQKSDGAEPVTASEEVTNNETVACTQAQKSVEKRAALPSVDKVPAAAVEKEAPAAKVKWACGLKRHDKKAKREAEFKGSGKGWSVPPEDPKQPEFDLLHAQWRDHLQPDAEAALFPQGGGVAVAAPAGKPKSMEASSEGLAVLEGVLKVATKGGSGAKDRSNKTAGSSLKGEAEEVDEEAAQEASAVLLEHSDLVFKWVTVRLCERESVPVLQRLLEMVVGLLTHFKELRYALSEAEAQVLLPYLCEKSGNSKQRFRDLFKSALGLANALLPTPKAASYLLAACASTKRAPSRAVCLDEFARMVKVSGDLTLFATKPRKGASAAGGGGAPTLLVEAARYAEATDNEVRSAALGVCVAASTALKYDVDATLALLKGQTILGESGSSGSNGNNKTALSSKACTMVLNALKNAKKDAVRRDSPRLKENPTPTSVFVAGEPLPASSSAAACTGASHEGMRSAASMSEQLASMQQRLQPSRSVHAVAAADDEYGFVDDLGSLGEDSARSSDSGGTEAAKFSFQHLSLATPAHGARNGGGSAFGGQTPSYVPASNLTNKRSAMRPGGALSYDNDEDDPFTFRPPPATPAAAAAAMAAHSVARSQRRPPAVLNAPPTAVLNAGFNGSSHQNGCPNTSLPGCGGGFRGDDLELLGGAEEENEEDEAAEAAEAQEAAAAEFQRIRTSVEALLLMPPSDAGGTPGLEGRRAMKTLYAVCCEPDHAIVGAEQQLSLHGDALAVTLAAVARLAFICGPPHKRGYDKEMLSLALSTCSALCKCGPVSKCIGAPALQAVLESSVGAMLPQAPVRAAGDEAVDGEDAITLDKPMLAALNRVSVEAASGCRRSGAVAALLLLLAGRSSTQNESGLSAASDKRQEKVCMVYSKLLAHLMEKERKEEAPYAAVDLAEVAPSLVAFFAVSEGSDARISKHGGVVRTLLADLVKSKGHGKGGLSLSLALDGVPSCGPEHPVREELANAATATVGTGTEETYDEDLTLEKLVRSFSAARAGLAFQGSSGADKEVETATSALSDFVRAQEPPLDVVTWLTAAEAPPALMAAVEAAVAPPAAPVPPPTCEPTTAAAPESTASVIQAATELLARPNPPPLPPPPPSAFIRRYKQETRCGAQASSSSAAVGAPKQQTSAASGLLKAAGGSDKESADDMLARIRQRLAGKSGPPAAAAPPSSSLAAPSAVPAPQASVALSSSLVAPTPSGENSAGSTAPRPPLGEATNRVPLNVADRLAMLKARRSSNTAMPPQHTTTDKEIGYSNSSGADKVASAVPAPVLTENKPMAAAAEPSVADRLAALRARLPAARNA